MSVDNSEIKIKNNLFSDTEHGALIDLRARPPQVKTRNREREVRVTVANIRLHAMLERRQKRRNG